jgi:hypothetical protein
VPTVAELGVNRKCQNNAATSDDILMQKRLSPNNNNDRDNADYDDDYDDNWIMRTEGRKRKLGFILL